LPPLPGAPLAGAAAGFCGAAMFLFFS